MKKSCLFGLLFLMALPLFAEHVDPEMARKVATTFLNNNGAKADQLTDLSKEIGFSNLYIFNGNPGFVVIAADDCVQPILGYSLEGGFEANNLPDNLVWWLQGYNQQIQDLIDNASKAAPDVTKQWDDLISGHADWAKTRSEVGPFISTKWDQTYPYNYYCPTCSSGGNNGHVYTGCVATAMAQVLKYHSYPAKGVGSHNYTHNVYGFQSALFGETTYNWAQMPTKISSASSTTQKQAVATLIYHCGVSVEMNYGNTGSGAHSDDIAPALKKYFNYSQSTTYVERTSYTDEAWIALMRNELDASRPIVYGGMDSETDPQSGHSFVCDGYGKDGYENNYFNFNWGWSGNYNGYFSIDNMTPGGSGAGGGSHNYSFLQDAVIGIKPSTNNFAPTNLTYTLNGTTVTLNWTGNENVSSYNVYCNNNLIGNVSTNSYTGTALYGTNEYFVQSVDANGELSLPTNSVTVEVAYLVPTVNDLSATFTTNNAALTWSAPAWCYPQTPSLTLTYGDGIYSNSLGTGGEYNMYWGQRFPASNLTTAQNMVIYKISFYVSVPGTYECCIYQGSNSGPTPKTLLATYNINPTTKGWFDIVLNETLAINNSQDLWVVLHDNEYKGFPAAFGDFSEHDEGSYIAVGSDPSSLSVFGNNIAWLIRTYLTDGVYTYNLYQDGVKIANKLTTTTYNATLNNNAANQFVVKTNYYGGEAASNMVGHAKGNKTIDNMQLQANDLMTLTSGSTLTVTGTLNNTDPARLIIEDGAQLIHNTTGVKATLKKDIEPYTDVNDPSGWKFIASPVTEDVTPNTGNGLLNGNYDLYYYDEPSHYWMNYKAGNFDLAPKQGYLYATNAANNTLQFAGTLSPSNTSVASNILSWSADKLKGFNLVGNPFACNASINSDYYIIDDNTHMIVLAATDRAIAPGEGVLVQATAANQTVTFSRADGSKSSDTTLDLIVTDEKTTLDRIRVRMGNGNGMEKYRLDDKAHANLSFSQDGQDYAVVGIAGQTALPVQFKANQNGIYTISIESNRLDLDYLHLVDHLTGADIDLLQNPSYCFEARTDDYASRFRLVFDPQGNTDEISDDFVEGKTVIIDMTGRVVATEPNTKLVPGVYILRTVNGNETTSKKIIIK